MARVKCRRVMLNGYSGVDMKQYVVAAMQMAVLSLVAAGVAYADDNQGFYAGIRLASGKIDATETSDWGRKYKFNSSSEFSGGLFTGYRFHPNWGMEATVASLGDYAYALNGVGSMQDHIELSSFSTTLTGHLSLAQRFTATAKLGAAYVRATHDVKGNIFYPSNPINEAVVSAYAVSGYKSSENNIVPLLGVALDYKLNNNVGLQLGYEHYPSIEFGDHAKLDADMWVFNVSYRFGR